MNDKLKRKQLERAFYLIKKNINTFRNQSWLETNLVFEKTSSRQPFVVYRCQKQ